MPARSTAQRRLMALAAHHPERVSPKNRCVLSMSLSQLAEYASAPERTLPKRAKKKATRR